MWMGAAVSEVVTLLGRIGGSTATWVARLGFRKLHARWDPRVGLTESLAAVRPADRANAERYVKRLAEQTARELADLLELEFSDLTEGDIQDALLSIQTVLDRTDLTPETLVVRNLDAEQLQDALSPPADGLMSASAQAFRARVLGIVCRVIVDSALRLDAVHGAALSALLSDVDAVKKQIAEIRDEMVALHGVLRDRESRTAGLSRVRVPLPPLCVERNAEHDELLRRLLGGPDRPPSLVVVRGWPGVGKTTLVTHLAHDPRLLDRYGLILWVRAGQDATAAKVLQQLALQLGVMDPPSDNALAVEMLAALIQERPAPTMIIADDLWDADLGGLLLRVQAATLLVTTREPAVAESLAVRLADVYLLRELDTDRAVRLLATFAPQASARHPERARVLAGDLEGLPLALRVAGRMLETEVARGLGGELELFDELRETARLMEQRAPQDRYDPVTGTTPTVHLLMKRSTDRLDDLDRMRFALLGLLAPKPAMFGPDLLQETWEADRDDTRRTLRVLVGRGLVEAVPGVGMFQMHSLLCGHARTLFAAEH